MDSSRAHGFTLIEIIVSVTLLLVLSGLFMASYTGFNSSQTVKQSASTLIRNLQAVRTNAASGVKPAGCATLVGYNVTFTSDDYTSQARCLVGGVETGVGDETIYELPTGVTFTFGSPVTIKFYPLNRGASSDLTISITGFGTTSVVHVYKSGIVSD